MTRLFSVKLGRGVSVVWKAILVILMSFLFNRIAFAEVPPNAAEWDAARIQEHFEAFPKSTERLEELERIILSLDANTPSSVRITLDLKKLVTLTDIANRQKSADFAAEILNKYLRSEYESDKQFADTMAKVVQSLAKSSNIDLSYQIVQNMRETAYQNPDPYLEFKIDTSLVEIYNESFDYARASEIVLSMLANPKYENLEGFPKQKENLFNEAAFLYNRLGDGENALIYLDMARAEYEKTPQQPSRLLKKKALNNGNRGRAHLLLGNYEQAKIFGQKVVEAGHQLEQNYIIALGYRISGSAAYHLEQYGEAKTILARGIALADEHEISSIQKFLFADYANTLKKLEQFQDALYWSEKQTELEIRAREASASSRSELHKAEDRAMERFLEIKRLKKENEIQREASIKEHRAFIIMMGTTGLLLVLLTILGTLFYTLRKSQKKLIRSEKKATYDALHDALTGLPNRQFMRSYIDQELVRAKQEYKGLGFAHIDVDNFKEVNDSFGHLAGDFMLTELAKRMEALKGADKIFARVGGDEFLMIMTDAHSPDFTETEAASILEAIASPMNFEGITLPVSTSIGLSHYPSCGKTRDDLVANADLALYKAKQDGRGCIRSFKPEMREALSRRKELEAELVIALEENHINPFFQPQVNIETNEICGVETLARWSHGERGNISPDEFLPVAESSGLLVGLGRNVMEKAIEEAANWHAQGLKFGRLSLNASAPELAEDDFTDWLFSTAKKYDLPLNKLSIEILETVMITDSRFDLPELLSRLREQNVHVELDDFGTGYASLLQINHHEIDRVKIDRRFIKNLNRNDDNLTIVKAIVQIAKSMDIEVIAEGAETLAEMESLRNLDCLNVQGYGIAPPMPARAIRDWIKIFSRLSNPTKNYWPSANTQKKSA